MEEKTNKLPDFMKENGDGCHDHSMHGGDADILPCDFPLDAHDYMMLYLFGTNFGYDMHDYPIPPVDDPFAKSFDRAISYLPFFIDYLVAAKLPESGMKRTLEKMEKAGYSSEDIARFCRAWLETIENKELVCDPLMEIYLFGEYRSEFHGQNLKFDFSDKKDLAKAKASIPAYVAWLYDVFTSNCVEVKDYYDPDLVLGNLARKMQGYGGYPEGDICDFATLWVGEMQKRGKAFYSAMHLHLFGEHFRGTRVKIDGIRDFDAALALIPDHLDYIFAYEGFDDEYCGKFDPDCELYNLVTKMREQGYAEADVSTFVLHWVNGVEALHKPCNSPIYSYLFNWFWFKHKEFKIELVQNKKDFERALAFVPLWVAYLTDMSVQYHNGYSERDIFDLLLRMHEFGYEKERIESLLSAFLTELAAASPKEVNSLQGDLSYDAEKEPWLYDLLPVFDRYKTT